MNSTQYEKLMLSLRYWLMGLAAADPRYYEVLRALEFFSELHGEETRKNGARGFYHQLSIIAFVRNFHAMLPDPISIYIAILGHDGLEDYREREEDIRAAFPEQFGYFETLSKVKADGSKMPMVDYVEGISNCIVCIITKGADRVNNLSTMSDKNAFSYSKQEQYVEETITYYLPMLKNARRRFPQIEPICEAFKSIMTVHIHATERLHEAVKKTSTSISQKAIDENKAAFKKKFKADLHNVAIWMRDAGLLKAPDIAAVPVQTDLLAEGAQ